MAAQPKVVTDRRNAHNDSLRHIISLGEMMKERLIEINKETALSEGKPVYTEELGLAQIWDRSIKQLRRIEESENYDNGAASETKLS